jgi:HD-GYP domain-containing protein (c-di-GMP phosphodiesterase class II)
MVELDDPVYNALFIYTKALSVALGVRDSMTHLHSERVRGLAEVLGRACGLSRQELGVLRISASFHDIGKIGIPDRVLLKPDRFDEAEWDCMKEHSEIGERIIAAIELEGSQQAAMVIRQHHEHYDGSGYPDRLSGESISIYARIISIVDSYDAMAEARVYHRAKAHADIIAVLLNETGGKHDPQLIRIFCDLIDTSEFKTTKR